MVQCLHQWPWYLDPGLSLTCDQWSSPLTKQTQTTTSVLCSSTIELKTIRDTNRTNIQWSYIPEIVLNPTFGPRQETIFALWRQKHASVAVFQALTLQYLLNKYIHITCSYLFCKFSWVLIPCDMCPWRFSTRILTV